MSHIVFAGFLAILGGLLILLGPWLYSAIVDAAAHPLESLGDESSVNGWLEVNRSQRLMAWAGWIVRAVGLVLLAAAGVVLIKG